MPTTAPDNNSGYATGRYASPEQQRIYTERMEGYVERRNAEWLDRWTDKTTGEVPVGVKELCNVFRADGHLAKWAVANGLLHPDSVPEGGIKHRQIGRLTGIVYCRSHEDRKAIANELRRYIDDLEMAQITVLHHKHPELFDQIEGRWVVAPKDCVHDWEWLRDGGHRCKLCHGEWRPI